MNGRAARKKTFDVIDLPLNDVFMRRYRKFDKVAAAPLVSKRLHDQVRERIRHLYCSL